MYSLINAKENHLVGSVVKGGQKRDIETITSMIEQNHWMSYNSTEENDQM